MSQVSLQELTRIAFRYPEKGSINFNILETIIQSILRKIKLDEVKVLYNVATGRSDISEDPYYQEYAMSDDYLSDEGPSQVTETLWKNINIDSRAAAAEKGISRLHDYIDDLYEKIEEINKKLNLDELAEILKFSDRMKELEEKCKLLDQRIDDSNEERVSETERLEKIIEEMKAEQEIAKSEIDVIKSDLSERVASKSQLIDLEDDLNAQIMELLKMIPAEDSLVTISEHEDLLCRVEKLEMHDSFEKLEEEIEMLKNDMEEMKEFKTVAETFFDKTSEIEGILNAHKEKFDEVQSNLDEINEKLSQIDPDDINDSFANLEEEMERLKKDMEKLMLELEECQKEVRTFSQKMAHCNQWINRLEQVKVDKADLKQLLETKADLRLIKQKLDRSEFALVIGDIKEINEELERLTCKVKINEETMDERFGKVDEELSLQMYKEDFILGTEPIRNRIKALIYELKRVKEIALAHLFPDAPGIAKCISCNRGAHMGGAKYAGDASTKFEENESPDSRVRMAIEKPSRADKDFEDTYGLSVSPTDLDSVPFPPTDAPRERNPHHLPVLFAQARPNIGLTHEKRRSAIDKELDVYFSKKPVRPIDTGRIKPQQHATSLTTLKLPLPEIKGAVRKIPIIKNTKEEAQARQMLKPTEAFKRGTVFPPITNKK